MMLKDTAHLHNHIQTSKAIWLTPSFHDGTPGLDARCILYLLNQSSGVHWNYFTCPPNLKQENPVKHTVLCRSVRHWAPVESKYLAQHPVPRLLGAVEDPCSTT